MKIVQVSESAFSVKGHGVHTVFVETVNGLKTASKVQVIENSFAKADIRHLHTVGPYSLAQLLFGRGRKVVSAHVVPESFVGSLIGTRYWLGLARWYLGWFYNRADVVIAVSDATKDELQKMGVRSRIEVIYNMVDTSRYQSTEAERSAIRQQLGFDKKTTLVIGNGQVQPRKRVDTFVEIARQLPDMQFVWVGGMPFGKVAASHTEMQQLIDSAPDNLKFTGVIELDEVRQYMVAGDIFVMTSEQETFGLAIVEAAASGMPVVLRDIADYDSTFRPDAVMVDEQGFTAAIERIANDKRYYQQMKKHAEKLARRYDSQTIISQLIEVYKSLLVV